MKEAQRLRIAGRTIKLGDYVEVSYHNGGGLRGNITKLWSIENGDKLNQAQVNNGWCFHDTDYIYEHRPS